MGTSFEAVWGKIQRALRPDLIVKNWGHARGYTGKTFKVEHVDNLGIMVFGGDMTVPRTVGRGDFKKVYAAWDDYTAGERSRAELTNLSQNTTYVLSILHLVLDTDA